MKSPFTQKWHVLRQLVDRTPEVEPTAPTGGRLALGRVVSLSVMTVLGWGVIHSVGTSSSLLPVSGLSETETPQTVLPQSLITRAEEAAQRAKAKSTAASSAAGSEDAVAERQAQLTSTQFSAAAVAKASDGGQLSGNRIQLNGQTLPGFWQQRNGRVGISSAGLAGLIGAELMSTTAVSQQPIRWFPATQDSVSSLPAWWDATNRYVDITDLAVANGWSSQAVRNTLQLSMPQRQTMGIRQGKQTWGDRIVVDLNGPAAWQVEATDVYTVTVAGRISPDMVRAFRAVSGTFITQLHVAPLNGKTVLKIKTKDGAAPKIWTAGNPARVVIDIRRDPMIERDVAWAPGLRWRQQYITLGQHRFPVYMFVVQPNPSTLALRPIRPNATTAVGIEPILTTAQRQQVAAAVNAGFFNRNNQLPLGAVRSDGQWISGPILGRGAMAWNERGDLIMDRFVLAESVTTANNESFPVLAVNSGYVQAGIGRYTAGWGTAYTPIVDNEIVVTVQDNAVVARRTLGKAGQGSVPIPPDGYLLTLRSLQSAGASFAPSTPIALVSQSQPESFEQYPNVVGGGPLLIRDRKIVLDPRLEGFSDNFINGAAPRTAVGKAADGTWIIATMHDRVGGRGPTLSETAQIMQKLGAVDALNLDGGSSSSLYLGGQLLNRQPRTAARVNNGIGLFVLGRE
ncbi:MAG: phosphodiester glycosidase family protein [Cyanobacteria bacterium J06614_10]